MHASVRDGLEDLLSTKPSSSFASKRERHMTGCSGCASELHEMQKQSELLRTLRPADEAEPAAGFYARVLQRIEASARRSIWWVFIYSPLGKKFAYGWLAFALVLGSYLIASEGSEGHLGRRSVEVKPVEQSEHYDMLIQGNTDEQRAAVLANFVAHKTFSE